MNTITAAITAVGVMFLTLFFKQSARNNGRYQRRGLQPEQELKKEEFSRTRIKEHHLAIQAAQDLLLSKY
jgi:hypothetical protein